MLEILRKAFFKAAGQSHLPPGVSGTVSLVDRATSMTLPNTRPMGQPGKGDIFNEGGQYPPGEPLQPLEPDRRPQQFQFTVGRNIVISPRTDEGRTPFAMLRSFADSHDVSRLCIEIRKEQIGGMNWDILPINAEDRDLLKKNKKQVEEIKDFFSNPDGNLSWYDWIGQVLEEVFVVDALTLYKRRTRGGKLFALEVVDGTTIKPLIDSYGRVPADPYPAYQQIIYGYPRGTSEANVQGFTQKDLIYNPKNRRSWTMYGFSPIEYILMKVNLALNRDMFMLSWFNQGTMPDGGIYSLPPTSEFTGDVEKIQQLQSYIDDMCSGVNRRRSGGVLFLPDGKFTATKEFKFDPAVDEWLARIAAVAFGVNPQHFTKMMTRSTGETQKEMTSEVAIKPSLRYLESILTNVMREFWDIKGMKFKFLDEDDDQALEMEKNVQYVKAGIMSIDEVRGGELGLPPIFGDGESLPNMVFTAQGFMPITRETVAQAAAPPPTAPMQPPFGESEGSNIPGQPKGPSEAAQVDQNGKPLKPAVKPGEGSTKDEDAAKKAASQDTGEKATTQKVEPEKETAKPTDEKAVPAKKKVKADLNKMERYFETAILRGISRPAFHSGTIAKPLLKCLNTQAMKCTETSQVHSLFKAVSRAAAKRVATIEASVRKYQSLYGDMLTDEASKFLPKIDKAASADEIDSLIDDHEFFAGYDIGPIVSETVNLKQNVYSDAEQILSSMAGKEIDTHFSSDYATTRAEKYAGDLIRDLSDTTRDSLKSMVATSVQNEEDWSILKDKLLESYDFSDRRAETIARTESGRLYNEGFIDAAKASGIVTKVLVFDGEEYDDECAEANGEEWDLDEALDRPLEHPNCVREFQYIIDDEATGESDQGDE